MSKKHDPSLRSDLRDRDDRSQDPLEEMLRELGEVQRRVEPPIALQAAWKRKQFDVRRASQSQPKGRGWATLLRSAGGVASLACVVAVVWWLKQPLSSVEGGAVSSQRPRQIGAQHAHGIAPFSATRPGRQRAHGPATRGLQLSAQAPALSRRLLGIIRQCVAKSRRDVFATPALRRKQVFVSYKGKRLSMWLRLSLALHQQTHISSCLNARIPRRLKAAPAAKRPQTWLFVVRDGGRRPTVAFLDLQRAFRKGMRRLIHHCVKTRMPRHRGTWKDVVTIIFLEGGGALVSASSMEHRRQVTVAQSSIDCIRKGLGNNTFQGTSLPYQKLGLYAGSGYSLFWRVASSSEHLPSLWIQPLRMERARQTQQR